MTTTTRTRVDTCRYGVQMSGRMEFIDPNDWQRCAEVRDSLGETETCEAHSAWAYPREYASYHGSFLNERRPLRWPGEEDHWRSGFQVGDRVDYNRCTGTVAAFNNTWSSLFAGRLVYLSDVVWHSPDGDVTELHHTFKIAWESDLSEARS